MIQGVTPITSPEDKIITMARRHEKMVVFRHNGADTTGNDTEMPAKVRHSFDSKPASYTYK